MQNLPPSNIPQAPSRDGTNTIGSGHASLRERRPEFRTTSDIVVHRVYGPADVGVSVEKEMPGTYPYTRGIQSTMYRGRLWTMRQYAGFGSAQETNRRFRYLLDHGQNGLSLAFDLPTQLGLDSDHERAAGEVGRVGVAIDSVDDMEAVFDAIPMERVSTSMTINAPASVLLAMYCVAAEKRGVARNRLSGTVQNDILKEYIARGTYIYPPQQSMRLCTDVIVFCAKEMPRWNPISISGYHMREAGCTAVQEVAFTLANGRTYARSVLARGLPFDSFAPRLSFFFEAAMDLFEEVAKFRAARRIWARVARHEFGARDARSEVLRFHAQTGGSSLTAQQPLNNVVRVTLQALAAVLGGVQSLHTNSYDEALALPTEESALLALRTQQIIAHESGATATVDPLGGSWFVEKLTSEIEAAVDEYFQEIEKRGGMLRAIESGYVNREIQNASYAWQQAVEHKDAIVVGVNEHTTTERPRVSLQAIRTDLEAERQAAVRTLRLRRDAGRWKTALEALDKAAAGDDNIMPPIIEAVRAYATIGEICDVLRERWGVWRPSRDF